MLVLAGAGSGKTRVIIQRIAHLIGKHHVLPHKILAMTFTNKAAEEMRERLRHLLSQKQVKVQMSTFHSLCVRILRKYIHLLDYHSNFTIYDTQDQMNVIKSIFEETDYRETGLWEPKNALFEMMKAKSDGLAPEVLLKSQHSMRDQLLGRIYEEYQFIMKGCNAVDFEDLLQLTLRLFEQFPSEMEAVCDQYRYVMVDEYQDTNTTQYNLLRHLVKTHNNLCVVGDDDQSIYGWRGANVQNILDFEKDFPAARVIKLEQNYRSTQTILDAANQVIRHNPNRFEKTLWSKNGPGRTIEVVQGNDEADEMERIVLKIRVSVQRQHHQFGDYCILYRSNFQSRAIEEALREGNIPYRVMGAQSFYDRREVKDALAYLHVIQNPKDEINLLRVINFPKRGIGRTSLIHATQLSRKLNRNLYQIMTRATEHEEIPTEAARSMEAFVYLTQKYRERFTQQPLHETFEELLSETGFLRALESEKGDSKAKEKRIACVFELLRSLRLYAEKNPGNTLGNYLERVLLFSREDPNQDTPANQVTLMTFHSAKGLEFPVVFMVGMAEGIFPNPKSLEGGGLEEERRLCYVGMTRAMQHLVLSFPKRRKRYGEVLDMKPSRFITDVDPNLLSSPLSNAPETVKKAHTEESRSQFFDLLKNMDSPGS